MKAFVNAHVNASHEDGREIASNYVVNGFPTLVVVDEKGDEIDRIVGYMPPEPFLKEIGRIQRGEDTLPALTKKAAENPDDLAAALALVTKRASSKPEDALATLEALEK